MRVLPDLLECVNALMDVLTAVVFHCVTVRYTTWVTRRAKPGLDLATSRETVHHQPRTLLRIATESLFPFRRRIGEVRSSREHRVEVLVPLYRQSNGYRIWGVLLDAH
jgi:hypothetical protein